MNITRKRIIVPEDIRSRVVEVVASYNPDEKTIKFNVVKKNIFGIYLVGNEFDEYNAVDVKSVKEFNKLFNVAVKEIKDAPANFGSGFVQEAKRVCGLGKLPTV